MTFAAFGTALLVPPANLAVIALLGLAWGRRGGWGLATLAVGLLVLLSMPVFADTMLLSLGDGVCGEGCDNAHPGAIIVLGAEIERDPSPAHNDLPGPLTLERLRAGAALARSTGLPLLVSGGIVDPGEPPVAEIMAKSLTADFLLAPTWVEARSATTWDNAQDSASLLRRQGITTVLVVTNAWHMRRALIAFRQSGLLAIPSPLRHTAGLHIDLWSFVPRSSAWMTSYYAFHEWIGCAWYLLRSHFAHE